MCKQLTFMLISIYDALEFSLEFNSVIGSTDSLTLSVYVNAGTKGFVFIEFDVIGLMILY